MSLGMQVTPQWQRLTPCGRHQHSEREHLQKTTRSPECSAIKMNNFHSILLSKGIPGIKPHCTSLRCTILAGNLAGCGASLTYRTSPLRHLPCRNPNNRKWGSAQQGFRANPANNEATPTAGRPRRDTSEQLRHSPLRRQASDGTYAV